MKSIEAWEKVPLFFMGKGGVTPLVPNDEPIKSLIQKLTNLRLKTLQILDSKSSFYSIEGRKHR